MARLTTADLQTLEELLGPGRVLTGESELSIHSRDESHHPEYKPEAVIYPQDAQEISKILAFANERKIPVTAWGAGTSLEANPVPVCGGIVLDLSRMNQILAIYPEDLQAVVQPGVTRVAFNQKLAHYGLFFPPDPGADCTIGGMVANNAAGIQAIKYGATKDYVLALEVVLANGEVLRVGNRALRTSSGYDLVHLFVGSEGTLGIFTEITLRVAGIPKEVSAATAAFPTLEQAAQAVVQIVQSGLEPAALELLDPDCIHAINYLKNLSLALQPTLFLEFRGHALEVVRDDLRFAQELCEQNGCTHFSSALGREERDRLWEARHHLAYAAAALNPGKRAIAVDVAVPISKFPFMVEFARQKLTEHRVNGPIFGHAGDGNFHVGIFYNPEDPDEKARAQAANDAIVFRAIELGGTATGEHGVGLGKIKFMRAEHGASYDLMRQIKRLLDPHNILNPGKIFPE
ncbi:MAG: FAD-binding oxidoreductase [Candidatus Bipolaricaulota bacterium]|nr:FAD-binding oxidoreductase [Candidatus Bipolaricaulota bacterium]MCS7275274.1 FAD-binding oxidoreductase [Candidatus Bipolaricaulota bacterium]MDW8111546.1 FAD-binding oxidoreductase [Candidatus Bipolaricaulota bacterium]MDW8329434.1 FAD-binding oxidoreductase [Candidatus Bipolaricaulota bacterium]